MWPTVFQSFIQAISHESSNENMLSQRNGLAIVTVQSTSTPLRKMFTAKTLYSRVLGCPSDLLS